MPEESAADYLIESSCVVLAREDPLRPFSFVPIEVLKGEYDGSPIDLFLDSVTRLRLANKPERCVVLVKGKGDKQWRTLGLASTDFQAAVRRIVVCSSTWSGPMGKDRRVEFFLPLFGHRDPLIAELAYLEMGRAPYRALESLCSHVSSDQVQAILSRPEYAQWRSLAILLMGHRGEPKDEQIVAESLRRAERFGLTTDLAALAAAAIELNADEAMEFFEERYFRNPDRSRSELTQVLKATSLHGAEQHAVSRERIVESYRTLLAAHPEMASVVAPDLAAWDRDISSSHSFKIEPAIQTSGIQPRLPL